MKSTIFLLVIASFQLTALAQKKETTYWNEKTGQLKSQGLLNRKGYKEGKWQNWYKDGQLRSEEHYENGVKLGKCTYWHPNGQLKNSTVYVPSDYFYAFKIERESLPADGDWASYFPNGQTQSEGKYVKGGKDGIWTDYYENGGKKKVYEIYNELKAGQWEEYYGNGQQKSIGNYKKKQ